MFNFRIIEMADGTQIIDHTLKTPYNSLTTNQMLKYIIVNDRFTSLDRITKRKKRMEKKIKNPLYKFACFCGLL